MSVTIAHTDSSGILNTAAQTAIDTRRGDVLVTHPTHGAKGDGTTDDTTALNAALTAGAGGRVVFPPPSVRYKVTAPLTIPANTEVVGMGKGLVELQVPAGADFRVFDLDGVSNVRISGFKITKASGTDADAASHGVSIRGAATDVVVERVHVDGLGRGHNVAGEDGTTSGTAERITFRDCRGDNSPVAFGFNLDNVDGVLIDNCHAEGNWLDGIKLRRHTFNVTVRDADCRENGVSGAGDGMDTYAGGDTFLVSGGVFEGNTGQGLTVKSGDLTQTDSATYGFVRNAQIIGVRCRNNASRGLYLTVSGAADLTEPLLSGVDVIGGQFEGNGTDGLYVNARNVTVVGGTYRKNQQHGINISTRAIDVELIGVKSIANSQEAANLYHGINIAGTRVRVRGGLVLGVDADTVAVEGDYAALTKYHNRNIFVASTAVDVEIHNVTEDYNATAQGIRCDMTSGVCLIHQRGTGLPSNGVFGSIGSTWIRTDAATAADVLWVKTSGAPNASTTGWQSVFEVQSLTAADIAAGTFPVGDFTFQGDIVSSLGALRATGSTTGQLAVGTSSLPSNIRAFLSGSTTAASAAAVALSIGTTLAAAANSDSLYGIRVNPSFTPGAFTGVTQYGIRVEAVSGGATNYAIHTGAGIVHLGGDLEHVGSKAGFFNVAPVSRPAALTQTYSTADRTLGAYTADVESTAYTGQDNAQEGSVYAKLDDLNALRTAYENLRKFVEDLAQHHNAVVDDLQLLGLEQ